MSGDWIEFSWDGQPLVGRRDEPLAVALWRAGIRTQTRSIKYHRPRGPQCMSGGCPGCMVRVDGIPNVLGCQHPLEPGAKAESQVGIPSAKRDLLSIVDRVMGHFDHERDFMTPSPVRAVYEAVARRLAGFGTQPTATPEVTEGQSMTPDVLIAGHGPAGLAAAHEAGKSAEVVLVGPGKPGASLLHTPGTVEGGDYGASPGPELAEALTESLPDTVTVVDGEVTGLYPEAQAVVARTDEGVCVHRVQADRLILATGAREGVTLLPGSDKPGVLGARAGRILLNRWGVPPGEAMVSVAPGEQGRAFVEEARARGHEVRVLDAVDRIGGDPEVAWVEADGQRHDADTVLLDPGLRPAIELAQQAGVPLTYEAALGGHVPLHQPDGATPVPGVHVAGGLAGLHHPAPALVQGRLAGARATGREPAVADKTLLDRWPAQAPQVEALERVWRQA